MLSMRSELKSIASHSVHCKPDFFLEDSPLHSHFDAVENALRVCRVDLLPYQQCLSTKGSTLCVRVGDAVLNEGLEHCFGA